MIDLTDTTDATKMYDSAFFKLMAKFEYQNIYNFEIMIRVNPSMEIYTTHLVPQLFQDIKEIINER